jgi:hypothetical protein
MQSAQATLADGNQQRLQNNRGAWRVARGALCGICSLFVFNQLHLPSGKLT